MVTATGDKINYSYDGLKRLDTTSTTASNGTELFSTEYTYQDISDTQTTPLVEARKVYGNDGSLVDGYTYEYDALGNITAIYEGATTGRLLVEYTYDSQNQLSSEIRYTYRALTSVILTVTTYSYIYDTAGNILSETTEKKTNAQGLRSPPQRKPMRTATAIGRI